MSFNNFFVELSFLISVTIKMLEIFDSLKEFSPISSRRYQSQLTIYFYDPSLIARLKGAKSNDFASCVNGMWWPMGRWQARTRCELKIL